jgi:bifunctional non-homologous end joining protein LigD
MAALRSNGFISPCIPTRAGKPPSGPDWVHEIRHDGYRLQVRRDGDTVRLFTRRGYDWSGRYPAIAVTTMQLRARSFTLDGKACVCKPGQPGDDPGARCGVVGARKSHQGAPGLREA